MWTGFYCLWAPIMGFFLIYKVWPLMLMTISSSEISQTFFSIILPFSEMSTYLLAGFFFPTTTTLSIKCGVTPAVTYG